VATNQAGIALKLLSRVAVVALIGSIAPEQHYVPGRLAQLGASELLVATYPKVEAGYAEHPKYKRVDGGIETLWQRPKGTPKGIFFAAHGCCHQGPDYFSEVEPDGWKFEACADTYVGHCLGLPEEVHFRHAVLTRGYVFVAVSGGSGVGSCWSEGEAPKVKQAIEYVRKAEGLPATVPVFATGSSSGGSLMTPMADSDGVQNLKCIVPMVSTADATSRKIPTLHVEMSRDSWTDRSGRQATESLKRQGVRAASISARPLPLTEAYLSQCLSDPNLRAAVIKAMRQSGDIDAKGLLKYDARESNWREPVRKVIAGRSADTLVADQSCLSELMNVAWSFHEFTGEMSEQILDFCEGKGEYATS